MRYTDSDCSVLKEAFPFMQGIMKEQLNVIVNDSIERVNKFQYRAQGEFKIDIGIIVDFAVRFDFVDIFYFEKGILYSRLESPIIDTILMDINRELPVVSAMRLADSDKAIVFSVIDNLRPILMISYNKHELVETYTSVFKVVFDPIDPDDSDKSFSFITGSSAIQSGYEYCGFKMFYTLEGISTHNDLEIYKERVSKVWNLSHINEPIDYNRLGLLTDMLYI